MINTYAELLAVLLRLVGSRSTDKDEFWRKSKCNKCNSNHTLSGNKKFAQERKNPNITFVFILILRSFTIESFRPPSLRFWQRKIGGLNVSLFWSFTSPSSRTRTCCDWPNPAIHCMTIFICLRCLLFFRNVSMLWFWRKACITSQDRVGWG